MSSIRVIDPATAADASTDRPSIAAAAVRDEPQPAERQGRNLSLDGLRGCAALSVALGHCALVAGGIGLWERSLRDFASMSWSDVLLRALSAVFPSDAAVVVFFVLSGHVLWMSFRRKDLRFVADLPDYACARAYRLFPLAIMGALPIAFLTNPPARALVMNMLLLSHDLNGVLWSLQVEVVASLGLFALWGLTRGSGWRLLLALGLGFAAIPLFRGNPYVVFFPAFILGALISCVPARFWHRPGVLPAGIAALLLTNLWFGHGGVTRCFEMAGATIVVAAVASGRLSALRWRLPHFLGAISYPFYLTHSLVLAEAARRLSPEVLEQPFVTLGLLGCVTLAATIPAAWLLHVFVEDPVLRARPRFGG